MTGKLDELRPDAKVIHADIDPAEIGKNRRADVPIVGDVGEVIATSSPDPLDRPATSRQVGDFGWRERARGRGSDLPLGYDDRDDGTLARSTSSSGSAPSPGRTTIYVAGVGQHQMWAAQFVSTSSRAPGSTRRLGHGLLGAGGDGRQGRPSRTRTVWASTATAASR